MKRVDIGAILNDLKRTTGLLKTVQRNLARAAAADDDEELKAQTWIASNPHQALSYALAAHEAGWVGCQCTFQREIDFRLGAQDQEEK